jgi:putative transcriptional regulator
MSEIVSRGQSGSADHSQKVFIEVNAMPTEPCSHSDLDLARIDWQRVDAATDEEIARQAEADADTAPVLAAEKIIAAGRRIRPEDVADVRALRTRLGLSQEAFATRFGFSVDAIRQYESHRRVPTGPARTLLRIIAREPDAVNTCFGARGAVPRPILADW